MFERSQICGMLAPMPPLKAGENNQHEQHQERLPKGIGTQPLFLRALAGQSAPIMR